VKFFADYMAQYMHRLYLENFAPCMASGMKPAVLFCKLFFNKLISNNNAVYRLNLFLLSKHGITSFIDIIEKCFHITFLKYEFQLKMLNYISDKLFKYEYKAGKF
jgi:hypothetical protein